MNTFAKIPLMLALALAPALAWSQSAADYPNRTVKILVPNPPGGPVDAIARVTASFLEGRFKQPFIVENRPGASSQLATDAVVKAAPDGYSLLVTSTSLVIEQATNKEWPFRFDRDVTPISILSSTGYAFSVSNKTPAANLRELVAYSKANPGKLNEAMPGGFNADNAILRHTLGMGPVEFVMYAGAAPAVTAMIAGEVDFSGVVVLPVMQLEKAGKLRIFAYTGKQRHPLIPHVPTVNEAGVGQTDFETGFWIAAVGPAGMSSDLVTKLNSATADMARSQEITAKVASMGLVLESPGPAQSRARMATLFKQYQDALAAGVRMR